MKVWKPSPQEIEKAENWGTWKKEISEFPWFYDDQETCYILDGEATATDNKGNTVVFGKGDMVRFEKGLSCTWKIVKDIRKKYYFG